MNESFFQRLKKTLDDFLEKLNKSENSFLLIPLLLVILCFIHPALVLPAILLLLFHPVFREWIWKNFLWSIAFIIIVIIVTILYMRQLIIQPKNQRSSSIFFITFLSVGFVIEEQVSKIYLVYFVPYFYHSLLHSRFR